MDATEIPLADIIVQLKSIDKRLAELVTRWNETDPLPKAHYMRRRRQAFVIALLVVVIGLTNENMAISNCFLAPTQTGWNKNICVAIFPGYSKAISQSKQNIQNFQNLLSVVPQDHQRLLDLEQKVNVQQ